MNNFTRRHFLQAVAASGAAAAMLGRPGSVRGANDAIGVGFIGIGSRGAHSVNWFRKVPGVRIVALCDADRNHLDKVRKNCEDAGESVKTYLDARELLEDKNVDVVVISSTNHTHALLTIWACQAGKDVYVEKPASHNLFEGNKMIEAARKYNRIVQVGTQNRSDVGLIPAFEYIHAGELGDIKLVRGFCYRNRNGIGQTAGPQPIPGGVDYNLWCGPAPIEPLMRKNLHYDWHWVWQTGNGDIGNQGPHELDLGRWVLKQPGLPKRVLSIGGRFAWHDDGETCNTQAVLFDYEPAPFIFQVRNLRTDKSSSAMDHYKGVRVGVVVECEGGYFAGGRNGGWVYDNDNKRIRQFAGDGGGNHARNFIDAVRSRKRDELRADIKEGVVSSALAHLANVSHRCGQPTSGDDIAKAVADMGELAPTFDDIREHLRRNEVDLNKTQATLGAMLAVDPSTGALTHKDRHVQQLAEALSTRIYRAPFVIGDEV